MKKRFYIAYGSNLHLEQMKYRCPTAKVVGKSELLGYKLIFKGAPTNAYATIEESTHDTVPVLIWKLQSKDEKALDIYEGYPTFYYKKSITVDVEGTPTEAMVYIMNEKAQIGVPSKRYYEIIRMGYKMANFDENPLENAIKFSKININRKES